MLPEADLTQVRWWLDALRARRHPGGVLALAARPVWSGPAEFELADGTRATVRLASSVLAIRDALTARGEFDWVVVLTDRDRAELPVGVLDHLVTGRLIELNPLPPLQSLFCATRREFSLLAPSGGGSRNRLARAALRELDRSDAPVPPAPGGVLTNDHLFGVLADRAFGLGGEVSARQVAVWSTDPAAAGRFAPWLASADPELAELLLAWIAGKVGRLGDVIVAVLRARAPGDVVPLGLVAALLDDTAGTAAAFPASSEELVRTRTLLEVAIGGHQLSEEQLIGWGTVATLALPAGMLGDEVLRRTEALVSELGADDLVGRSDVLPTGLAPRICRLAAALTHAGLCPDDGARLAVENAWADVMAHNESHADTRNAPRDVRVAAAAVRLWRWQSQTAVPPAGLADWVAHYRRELSWVDAAVNDAFVGAHDPALASFADAVVTEVRSRRAAGDRDFARLLASSGAHRETGAHAPLYIEDVLDRVIAPLTVPRPVALSDQVSRTPVLLVVADGMSAAVAGEVVADAVARGRSQWQECRFADTDTSAALAALPTLTEVSRCSLLCGRLQRGAAGEEVRGFTAWLTARGMAPTGKVLFHKADLDAVSRGNALAAAVRSAIEDTTHRPVVACVLNDIDDALDRSDPIGTTWDVASFKHLDPLLKAAAAVGRIVVLLSDHGHVPERREQPSVQRGQQVSARCRLAHEPDETAVEADEVLVEGPRVLRDGHRAVLAVDEQVRYTTLKAGYHGGGAPAEAVIPISMLVNGAISEDLGLEAEPTPEPSWWSAQPAAATAPVSSPEPVRARNKPTRPQPQTAALFDTDTLAPVADSPPSQTATAARDEVDQLLRSPLFTTQFQTFGRNLKKPQVGGLLREAIAAGGVLPLATVARLLGVKTTRVGGAVSVLAQVLNTDGVEVLTTQGSELVVKQALMFEQFGVSGPGGRR
jgi:hypothetical protein